MGKKGQHVEPEIGKKISSRPRCPTINLYLFKRHTVSNMLLIYSWHGKHHTTQIINTYETAFFGHTGPSSHPQ